MDDTPRVGIAQRVADPDEGPQELDQAERIGRPGLVVQAVNIVVARFSPTASDVSATAGAPTPPGVLAIAADIGLSWVQRWLTPKGLRAPSRAASLALRLSAMTGFRKQTGHAQ